MTTEKELHHMVNDTRGSEEWDSLGKKPLSNGEEKVVLERLGSLPPEFAAWEARVSPSLQVCKQVLDNPA